MRGLTGVDVRRTWYNLSVDRSEDRSMVRSILEP